MPYDGLTDAAARRLRAATLAYEAGMRSPLGGSRPSPVPVLGAALFGTLDDDLEPGASATLSVEYLNEDTAEWEDSERDETVWAPATQEGTLAAGQRIGAHFAVVASGSVRLVAATAGSAVKYGKTDAAWTTGTATVSVWVDGADSGDDLEDVAMVPWIDTWDLDADTWVRLESVDGTWYAEPRMSWSVVTDQRIDTATKKLQVKTRAVVGIYAADEGEWTDKYTFVTVTAQTSEQIDTSTKKLQRKTTQFWAVEPQDESEWEDIYSFVAISPLTAFQVDGANKKLQDKTTQNWVVFADAASAWVDIHTGTVCP